MIRDFDMQTRTDLYSFTIKLLRKYHKGLAVGKLSPNQIVTNIISNENLDDIIDSTLLDDDSFKESYTDYIDTLLKQNGSILSTVAKKKYTSNNNKKPSIPDQLKLKNLLDESPYSLTIPLQYLSEKEVDSLIEYLTTGHIDFGNERVYNFIKKELRH